MAATRTDPRIRERRVLVARAEGRRRRRLLLGVLAGALLAAGALYLLHSPVFGARHVVISGSAHVPDAEVVRVAGLAGAPPLMDLSATAVARRVERLPWVARAKVAIAWPSTVRIRLSERTPVAVVPAGRRLAVVDRTGRVLGLVGAAARPAGLPLVEVSGKVAAPGHRLADSGPAEARVASLMPESMVRSVADLRVTRLGIVADLRDGLRALLGSSSSARAKFVSLATVLAHGDLAGARVVDVRDPANPVLVSSGPEISAIRP